MDAWVAKESGGPLIGTVIRAFRWKFSMGGRGLEAFAGTAPLVERYSRVNSAALHEVAEGVDLRQDFVHVFV